jgi:UDP-N-acetylglucosamine:LPS N-acetylglucosamine transferase
VLRDLGLDPRAFTILFMVGAEGSRRAIEHIQKLTPLSDPWQLIVMCGRDRTLLDRVAGLRRVMPVRALAYVSAVADLMHAADVLVTKAGGATLAEAFNVGIPVVVNDVVPGQETGNRDLLLRQRAIAYAPTPARLIDTIRRLAGDGSERAELAHRARALVNPAAASEIVGRMLLRLRQDTLSAESP